MFVKLLRNHGNRHVQDSRSRSEKVKNDRETNGVRSSTSNGNFKGGPDSSEVECKAANEKNESSLPLIQNGSTSVSSGGKVAEEKRLLEEENAKLLADLQEKTFELAKLKEELESREDRLNSQSTEIEETSKSLILANQAKTSLTNRLTEQERKIATLEKSMTLPLAARLQQREELRVAREAISSLRQCFATTDPYQHTLDTIEQSLSTLLERVAAMEHMNSVSPGESEKSPRGSPRKLNFDSTGDPRRFPITNLQGLPVHRLGSHSASYQESTKVLYFTEKSVTPFMSVIPKKLGDITLRDFKIVFDRPGQYRFHFKTLDPEFGMVKEEVLHDDDILPGWDGKIIAWIEEDI